MSENKKTQLRKSKSNNVLLKKKFQTPMYNNFKTQRSSLYNYT